MRKYSILIAIVLLLFVACVCVMAPATATAFAVGSVMDYAKTENGGAYKAFVDFATMSNRTVGTANELTAANWLAKRLVDMGYTSVKGTSVPEDMCQAFTFTYHVAESLLRHTEKSLSSYNVVAYRRSGVEGAPLLVIAAPYSNEVDIDDCGYEDAAYSASSVGVLLSVAAQLSPDSLHGELSFDVAFAFMGAEYFNMAGTARFIEENTQPLLGAIYLSQVGVGDDLNIYYDEVSRKHGEFIDGIIAKRTDFAIEGKPFAPGYTTDVYGGNLPYGHVGLTGGNVLFMEAGVPSVHLFGYHWQSVAGSESATHGDIIFTESDTLDGFRKVYGEDAIRARLDIAADFVKTVVVADKNLKSAFETAKGEASYEALVSDAAYYGFRWSVVGIAVAVVVVLLVLAIRRAKRAGVPDFSVNSEFINGKPVDTSDASDIFDEAPIAGDSADVDHSDGDDTTDSNAGGPPDTNDIFGEF